MAQRVPPMDAIRAQIDELFASGKELGLVLEEVGRLSVRLMMQTAIEAEVDSFLGRQRCERREEDARAGYRNGHQPAVAMKTTMGQSRFARPNLRDRREILFPAVRHDGDEDLRSRGARHLGLGTSSTTSTRPPSARLHKISMEPSSGGGYTGFGTPPPSASWRFVRRGKAFRGRGARRGRPTRRHRGNRCGQAVAGGLLQRGRTHIVAL